MMLSACLLFSLLLLGVIQRGHNVANSQKTAPNCSVGQLRLIEGRVTVNVSGTVRGRIEICSDQNSTETRWEKLCDDNWTVEDVTVACRDLGYSASNAASFNPDIYNMMQTGYAYKCCGSESRLAYCRRHLASNCNTRIGVQCYNVTSINTTVSLSTTVCPSSSTMVSPSRGPSRLQSSSPSIYLHTTPTVQLVTPSPLLQTTTPTKNLYPIYVYATIGIVTVLVFAIVGIVIVVIIMCRISARRKQLTSPQLTQNNDYVPKEESLYSTSKDHTMVEPPNEITQHHIYHEVAPPPVHIYEDVKPNKQNCEQGGDYASLDKSTRLEPHHNSDSTSDRETTTVEQQHSYSCLNHKKPPPEKGKPYVPHAVNQLSFLMSSTKTNFVDSMDNTLPSDSDNPPTTAASNGVYGEQCGNHVYAILEDPSKCHNKPTSVVHYSTQGEVVGGHQYAILEAPTMPSHRAMHSDTGSTTSS